MNFFRFHMHYKNDKFIIESTINCGVIDMEMKIVNLTKKFDSFSDESNKEDKWIFDTDTFVENMKMLENTDKYNL